MNPAAKLWVYSRGGKPCRRCGAVIQSKKTGVDARITYWRPQCQILKSSNPQILKSSNPQILKSLDPQIHHL
jgi:hypothetical protein